MIQFKKGVLELCILSLLERQDEYGYELTNKIQKHIEINESAIYPILRRLVKEEYCETYLKESSTGPARKYYKLTAKGKEIQTNMTSEWELFIESVSNLISGG